MQSAAEINGPALVLVDTSGFVGNIPAVIPLSLPQKQPVIVGRGTPSWQATVPMNATRDGKDIISRKHAKLERSGSSLFITDLNSLNGTYVNSMRIQRHTLQDGDVVQFGGAAKLQCGDRLLASGASITYRFIGAKSSRKRKAVAIATLSPTPSSKDSKDEVLDLSRKLNEQEQQLQELLSKLQHSTTQVDKLTKELEDAREQRQPPRDDAEEGSRIDLSVLGRSLCCGICRGVLIDPVVLPCSHGFCLGCIVGRERKLPSSNDLCPTCRPQSKRIKRKPTEGGTGERYFRSNHLDTLLWVWSNATPEGVRKQHETREVEQRKQYEALGCVERGSEVEEASDSETSAPDNEALDQASDENESEQCPGCNEFGHVHEDCPHRSVSATENDEHDDDDY